MKTISRTEAREQGLPRYFTGKPCLRGHVVERVTASKTCVTCSNDASNRTKAKYWDRYLGYIKEWQKNNPAKLADYQRTAVKKNPGKRNLLTANYRQSKDRRQPKWLTDGEMFEMECVYVYCSALRRIGLDYHVDHVVPLRGKHVSGLHVPWNLQVIPSQENVRKSNIFHG